ncbi:response regulator transcription factor [Candidatus Cyanaurora vandensis]|uniref:response regulator transcription factor n=1 Tax=Candidatus Cyanaurora vandensis TaxID=2714958 RepID=UPI00257A14C0|nr:response regulator [Candidatus Cyanaurora vandensis]
MSLVLVIEDTLTDREVLATCLRRSGLEVLTCISSEEALEKLRSLRPDAIVLDVVLPGVSGFELCRELKSEPTTAQIPVVLCSTKGTDMDRFWGLRQGADAYLAKPVDQEELVRTVKSVLRK